MNLLRSSYSIFAIIVLLTGCDIYPEKEPEPEVVRPNTFNSRVDVGEHNKYYFTKALPLDNGKILLAGSRHSWNERDSYNKSSVEIMIDMVDEELHNQPALMVLDHLGARQSLHKVSPTGTNSYRFTDIVATEQGFIALENEEVNSMVSLGFSIVKLDSAGNFLERYTIDTYKRAEPKFMLKHSSGDLIIAGTRSDFAGQIKLETHEGTGMAILHGMGNTRFWTFAMRITQEGKVVWKKSWDGMALNAMTQDAMGNIYVMTDDYDDWKMDNITAIYKLNASSGSQKWKHTTVADRSDEVAMVVLPDSTIATLACGWNTEETAGDDGEWYDKEGMETLEYNVITAKGEEKISKVFAEGREIDYVQLLNVDHGVLAAGVDINSNTIYLWKLDVEGNMIWEKNFKNKKSLSVHGLFPYGEGYIGLLLDYHSKNINETTTSILRLTIDGEFEEPEP